MPDANFIQSSFLGGEWSKTFQGRYDRQDYRTGMAVCINGIPIEAGAWVRRPGTRHAGTTRGGVTARAVTFDFQASSPYTMELTDGHMRFWSGYNLVTTNDQKTVSTISSANPAKVATSASHGWSTGDQVFFSDMESSTPVLHTRQFAITVTSSTEFTIADAVTGTSIDGSALGSLLAGTKVNRVRDLATPYISGLWSSVRSIQAQTNAILLQNSIVPQVLSVDTQPTDSAYAVMSLAPAQFVDGPYLDPVPGSWVTLSGTTGLVTLSLTFQTYDATVAYSLGEYVTSSGTAYVSIVGENLNNTPASSPTKWTAVSQGLAVGTSGFGAGDIGRHVRLFSEPADWSASTDYGAGSTAANQNNRVKYKDAYWCSAFNGANVGVKPGGNIHPGGTNISNAYWVPDPYAAFWVWGKIVSVGTPISGTLSGSANIGNMSQAGGLTAAFDGVLSKAEVACAALGPTTDAYVGKNYSGASDQQIASVVVYPIQNGNGFCLNSSQYVTLKLRAKQTAPSSASDGTLLGTATSVPGFGSPVTTITSSDTATAWKYVWVEFVPSNLTDGANIYTSQVQFFNPSAANSTSVTLQLISTDALISTTVKTWRLGVYSTTTGWPTCGTYFENRLWLAGSIGNRIDASRSLDTNSLRTRKFKFSPTEPNGTVSDSCGINYTFATKDVNTIYWMSSDQQGIICGTRAGEWLVQSTSLNAAITPTNIRATRVTKIGCANIEPRRTEHTLVFVQKYGRKIIEYFADVFSGKFSAPNLSERAKHMTEGGIEEIAYQQELAPIIWARRGDGALIGATYKRESLMSSQGPTFAGWHRHELGSERVVESIAAGPSIGGDLDTLSMITNDEDTDVRHVEIMTDILDEDADITEAWFVDNAIVPAYAVSGSNLILTGLWPHNGKTVSVFAGGIDCGDFAVSSGQVTVPLTTDLTSAYIASFSGEMPVVAGFTYTSDGQGLRAVAPQESGARSGPAFGKLRRTQYMILQLAGSRGVSVGTNFSKLRPVKLQSEGGVDIGITELFSGICRTEIEDKNSYDGMLCWRVTRPYPVNIQAVGGFVQTSDA